jgi:uncharacterized protein involved in response to NO
MSFIVIQQSSKPKLQPRGFALWQLGFRPFYLLASVFAAGSIVVWAAQLWGVFGGSYLPGAIWHAHEMVFGFALAVIVGFLFTAVRNWSNRPTPQGAALAALAALWLAARCVALTPFGWVGAIVGPAFAFAAAAALAIPLWSSRNRRNYFFVALLAAFGLIDLVLHLALLGVIEPPPLLGLRLALDVVLFIVAVMAGRVIPMFTNNGIPGAGAQRNAAVERLALGSILVLALCDLLFRNGLALATVAFTAAALHAARWLLWHPRATVRHPLVWILHAAYAWIPVHLALRGMAALGWIAGSAATHALTVGAVGGLIMGMMTRTSRGHTGRPLRADLSDIACYCMVSLAALIRVFVPLLAPALTASAILVSAALWSGAFGLYAIRYWPMLTRARLDGAPG